VLDTIGEEGPVREPGELVVERLVPKLLLGLPARCDIEEIPLEHAIAGLRIGDHLPLVVDPDHPSVSGVEAVFGVERLPGRMRPVVCGEHPLAVVGM
jgi:hypothetical protein